jgi:hypothetical protein
MKKCMHTIIVRTVASMALASAVFLVPAVSFAQTANTTTTNSPSLAINCDGTATTTDSAGEEPCDFNALIGVGTNLIDWMFYIAVPIMVALLAYAGILYMTGIEKNISHAKGMFIKVAMGFTIMLIAFVCINTLVGWIGNSSFTTSSSGSASNPAVLLSQQSSSQ